ncbi:ATP-dependent DNA helicase [Acetonema longum]|uniref:DEAD_2 domain protein n=1 Tax=Acetonema longum DSM 6540 TaxID=1009370 RepID=F7NGS0_9FIRM|nr:ATP-dependent DNA helicase [Acetonema longum]EGO64651.1 DEAD_2 domain protein [Acetonema longum DSM 6540]
MTTTGNQSIQAIKVSVRTLVEFILRSGDLTSGFAGGSRALEGIKAHKRVQKDQPEEYRQEVSLSFRREADGLVLEISGRADGIITGRDGVTVDEIKSTARELGEIREEDNPLYWAQAKCYAYIYAAQNSLEIIRVQLTYSHIETREILQFRQEFTFEQLKLFFEDLSDRYLAWARTLEAHQSQRNKTSRSLDFPYSSYRKGQRELAVAVYKTILGGRKLFAQAPTGTGKTLAALFPAVKALGEGQIEKIFYLTAKTVTQEVAVQGLAKLKDRGLVLKSLCLTAKDKICFTPGAGCNGDECEYAAGHFDRVNQALEAIFPLQEFSRQAIEACARQHRVCPFELSLDLALWADCIICDYNYVFDPRVSLKRFFSETGGSYCFLADEAHNLPERAREMFSACLDKGSVLEMKRLVQSDNPSLSKALQGVNNCFIDLRKRCEAQGADSLVQPDFPPDLLTPLWRVVQKTDEWLVRNQSAPYREKLLELYFAITWFLRVTDLYDKRYVTYIEKKGADLSLKLFCIDPSHLLRQALLQGRAAVYFSATLTPLDYFFTTLGGDPDDYRIKAGSPFPRENLMVMVADRIQTTFKAREFTYDGVTGLIAALTGQKQGNYLVYFPSYQYMNEIAARFAAQYPSVRTILQEAGMPESEREQYLAQFVPDQSETLIGFAVMGGIFGEGIDLTGERLSGTIIVGVGLPQVCLEREIIRSYYQSQNSQGFDYAYTYPGMNKVMQAAGRVIRTDTDKGVVLLVDERFQRGIYRTLLPEWWKPVARVGGASEVVSRAREFWRRE